MGTRGTSNGNASGSSYDRRRRRAWLLDTFGDGVKAPCAFCGVLVDAETLTVDRIVPGCEGGTYRRGNIRPACGPCNVEHGSALGVARKAAKRAAATVPTEQHVV